MMIRRNTDLCSGIQSGRERVRLSVPEVLEKKEKRQREPVSRVLFASRYSRLARWSFLSTAGYPAAPAA
jgi:hypothetical protein